MDKDSQVDLRYLNELLVDRIKVKRRPIAISYCTEGPPAGYEPVNVVACAIVREAEEGRRVYVDAGHHDCWVGQYHLGWLPKAAPLITDGEYLTMAQGFFTPEGARRNKAQSLSLPPGTIAALAAAPPPELSAPRLRPATLEPALPTAAAAVAPPLAVPPAAAAAAAGAAAAKLFAAACSFS